MDQVCQHNPLPGPNGLSCQIQWLYDGLNPEMEKRGKKQLKKPCVGRVLPLELTA